MNDLKFLARFFSHIGKITRDEACWPWEGRMAGNGYGQFAYNGKRNQAHRVSYQIWKGEIPDGFVIDHICRNPICVNPHHLRAVTFRENVLENSNSRSAINARKTHCPKGHPYSGDNVLLRKRPGNKFSRHCRACMNEMRKVIDARRKEKLQDLR